MKYLFSAFMLLFSTALLAQADFKPGYIVKVNGEKQSGQIRYRSDSRNYQSAVFIQQGQEREFAPGEILGYGYENGKYYASGVVDDRFVEALVEGDLSLYRYDSKYYLKKENDIHELEAREVEVTTADGEIAYRQDNRWKGILSLMINDCLPNSNEIIARLDLNEQSLSRTVVRYNRCRGADFTEYKKDLPFTSFHPGLAAGVVFSKIAITNSDPQSPIPDSYNSTDVTFGGNLIISFPRISDRISIYTEASYFKAEYDGSVEYVTTGRETYYTSEISMSTINIPVGFRYATLEKAVSLFVMTGINYDLYLEWETALNTRRVENGITTSEPETELFKSNSSRLGFWAGAGVSRSIGKWQTGLSLRYFNMPELGERAVEADLSRIMVSITFSR